MYENMSRAQARITKDDGQLVTVEFGLLSVDLTVTYKKEDVYRNPATKDWQLKSGAVPVKVEGRELTDDTMMHVSLDEMIVALGLFRGPEFYAVERPK